MNTELLVRSTFVLDRVTSARLDKIARVFGRSRSDVVREVLAEPVRVMSEMVTVWETTGDIRQLQLAGLDEIDAASANAREVLKGPL